MNPTFDQQQAPPKKSRAKWYILIAALFIVPTVAILGIVVIVFGAVFFGTKSVEEYQCALVEVRKNDKAIEMLGTPMEEGLFMFPNIEISPPKRDVNFSTSMTGPKKSGTLYVSSERSPFRSNFMMALEVDGEKNTLYTGSYPCK